MKCPLCEKDIKDGALVCKHCKSKLMECPFCKEITDGNQAKCKWCDSEISIQPPSSSSNSTPTSNIRILTLEQEMAFKQRKKSILVSILWNLFWPGAGLVFAEKFTAGIITMIVSGFFYIIAFTADPSVSVVIVLALLISSIISYRTIDIQNQQLRIDISKL